jgi:hypothetical protein
MIVRIPYKLLSKFLDLEGLITATDKAEYVDNGIIYSVPGETHYMIQIDLTDEPESLSACYKWIRIIETYFKTSYSAFRIDIGPYEGLWPTDVTEIANRTIVHFQLDNVDTKRGNWKDWFVKEDRIIAPI